MNAHDTEKAISSLKHYELTQDPQNADLVLLNTCMVREKAANKVFSRIGELKSNLTKKRTARDLPVFGVMGCVAQAEAERLFERNPDIRLVLGTQAIGKLPDLVTQLDQGYKQAIDVKLSKDAAFFDMPIDDRQKKHIAYVSIMEGCNKFCSYCIVPFTRGRERSRPADSIVKEIVELKKKGYYEVQLLGQNVNSYGLSGHSSSPFTPDSGDTHISFASLLERIARETGISRIKFTTSYPKDFDKDIVAVIESHPNLCEWIHLPVQAGSDRILRLMRRGYTRQDYMHKIKVIKDSKVDFSITGDIIVGFPGETEDDFQETLSLIAEVGYDGLYIFKYSPRPRTPASRYTDNVPGEVVTERFLRVQELQARAQKTRYHRYLGKTVEVLVEGESVRNVDQLTGHTRCQKVVNFPKAPDLVGKLVSVQITNATTHSLIGQVV